MKAADAGELVGLAAIWGASFLFMRLGAGEFGPVALSAVRVAGAAAVLLPLLLWRGQWGELRRHWRAIFLVGLTNSALPFLLFSYAALSITAGLSSIFNAATPLFGAAIGWLWLRDRLTPPRVVGLAIGFAGVLIVTNPGSNSLTLGALFALTNAVMYGTVTVAVRGMTRTESANTLVIWQLAVLAFFHSFLLLFGWRSPNMVDAAMLFGTGFTNAIGQWFWTKALQLAPAPAVTPFYYLMLVWALMFGFFIWGDIPSLGLLVGSGIVVTTGLFLFLREARLQRQLATR